MCIEKRRVIAGPMEDMNNGADCCGITELLEVVTVVRRPGETDRPVGDPFVFHWAARDGEKLVALWRDRTVATLSRSGEDFLLEGGPHRMSLPADNVGEKLVNAWRLFVRRRVMNVMAGF